MCCGCFRGLRLGMIERASATDWMIVPDFQPKLGVQGCRVKVRGGLCGELSAGVLARGPGAERVLCTGGMATSHKPPQPYTSLWIRPVDNSARDVMKSPGLPLQHAIGCRSWGRGVLRDVLVAAGLEKNRRQSWHGPRDLLPADYPPVTARLWHMATLTQKARRSSSAMASGVTVTQPGPMTRPAPIWACSAPGSLRRVS